MTPRHTDYYRAPGAMTALPDGLAVDDLPSDLDGLRRVVQGVVLHRDLAPFYGVEADDIRGDEQQLRSTGEVLERVRSISDAPLTVIRPPIDRIHGICRHYTLLHTALLRAHDVPARVRCGFNGYYDPPRWGDHWITERWDGQQWIRDDPQVDELQVEALAFDFDPSDLPAGKFLTGSEAWIAARAGEVDPELFGIADMWGLGYIAGNVVSDFACVNKVELLPWDIFGMMTGPDEPLSDETLAALDDLAALVVRDDVDEIRARYEDDDRVRVPADIVSYVDGVGVEVHLDL